MAARPLVLVVEDDPSVLDMVRVVLSTEGYEVIIARDGLEGLLKAEFAHPALLVLDIMMPNVGGKRMLEEMRADPRLAKVPVIVITGFPEAAAELRPILGSENVLMKPFSPEKLLERVAALAGEPAPE